MRVHEEILKRQKLPPPLVSKRIWDERLADIAHFEDYLTRQGMIILKFFLNVSRKEQKKRFMERLDKPEKTLEVLRVRRPRAQVLGRLHARVRGGDPSHGVQTRAVVRGAGRQQVVHPACRRRGDRGGGGGARPRIPEDRRGEGEGAGGARARSLPRRPSESRWRTAKIRAPPRGSGRDRAFRWRGCKDRRSSSSRGTACYARANQGSLRPGGKPAHVDDDLDPRGVGLLLLGMTVMTEGLEALAGSSLRTVLGKAAATSLSGVSGAPWSSPCIVERDDHDDERVFFGEPDSALYLDLLASPMDDRLLREADPRRENRRLLTKSGAKSVCSNCCKPQGGRRNRDRLVALILNSADRALVLSLRRSWPKRSEVDMRHALTVLLFTASICAPACLIPGVAAANGADANAQANQAQLHPWEGNQTGWRPYGAAVGEVYPAAPGGFVGPNGYTNGYSGDYVVVPVVPVAPDYTYGYSPAPAYDGYYVVP